MATPQKYIYHIMKGILTTGYKSHITKGNHNNVCLSHITKDIKI